MYADEEISSAFPGVQAAVVTIKTRENTYTKRVNYPKGEPENPLDDQEFRDRYDGLMEYAGIDGVASDAVFNTVYKENSMIEDLLHYL